jgi:HEAT repeat protein
MRLTTILCTVLILLYLAVFSGCMTNPETPAPEETGDVFERLDSDAITVRNKAFYELRATATYDDYLKVLNTSTQWHSKKLVIDELTQWMKTKPDMRDTILDLMITLLKDESVYVRDAALGAISWTGDPITIMPLLEFFKEYKSTQALYALSRIKDPGIGPVMLEIAKKYDFHIREAAVQALVTLNYTKAVPDLIPLLDDHTQTRIEPENHAVYVSDTVFYAIGKLKGAEAIPRLTEFLSDPQNSGKAAQALWEIGDDSVVNIAKQILESGEVPIARSNAAWLIRKFNPPGFRPFMEERLEKEQDAQVRSMIELALRDLK